MDKLRKFELENSYKNIRKTLPKFNVSYTHDTKKVWLKENYLTTTYFVRNQMSKIDDGIVEYPEDLSMASYSLRTLNNDELLGDENEQPLFITDESETNNNDNIGNTPNDGNNKPLISYVNLEKDYSMKHVEGQYVDKFSDEYLIEVPQMMRMSLRNGSNSQWINEVKDFNVKYKSFEFEIEMEQYDIIDIENELPIIDKHVNSIKFNLGSEELSTSSMLTQYLIDTNNNIIYDGFWNMPTICYYDKGENLYEINNTSINNHINSRIDEGYKVILLVVDYNARENYYTMKNFSILIDDVYTMNITMYEYGLYTLKIFSEELKVNLITKIVINDEVQSSIKPYYQLYGDGNFTVEIYFNNSKLNCFENFFNGCEMLRSVDFSNLRITPKYLKTTENMFAGCHSLIELKRLENFNTYYVENMSGMFYECFQLSNDYIKTDNEINNDMLNDNEVTFDASLIKVDNVKYMDYMFGYCRFRHINTSTWNTSNLLTADFIFDSMELYDIDFSNWDMSNLSLESFVRLFGDNCYYGLKEILWTCKLPLNINILKSIGYYPYLNNSIIIYNHLYTNDSYISFFNEITNGNALSNDDLFTFKLTLVENGEKLTNGDFFIDGVKMEYSNDSNEWICSVKSDKFNYKLTYNDYIIDIKLTDKIIFFG